MTNRYGTMVERESARTPGRFRSQDGDPVPKVFINYRVRDEAGYAVLLYRELAGHFGSSAIFHASHSIRPGADFAREILENLRRCDVMLAVVGPRWLSLLENGDRGRFGGTDDWVRRELQEALSLGIRIIPILVEDATPLPDGALPDDIAALARCQYLRLHHRGVDADMARVVAELGRLVPGLSPPEGRGDAADPRRLTEAVGPAIQLFELAAPVHGPGRLGIVAGTIDRVRCADIWVSSENTDMEMSRFTEFSISAIIRYWGAQRDQAGWVIADVIADELAATVGGRRPVAPGTAMVTGAGALRESNAVHHVIHVAAVYGEPGAGFRPVRDVGRCVTNALVEADRLAGAGESAGSILFPLLGTGVGGAPIAPTARTLVGAAADYLTATPATALRVIYFLAYTRAELAALEEVLRAVGTSIPVIAARSSAPGSPDGPDPA